LDELALIILENVGNLVCPAETDTGAVSNVVILSVPEGDDKPLKYPLVFTVCDALVINKVDYLELTDFDLERARERAAALNDRISFLPCPARHRTGSNARLAALLARYTEATFSEGDLPELIMSKAWDVQNAAILCIGEAPGVLSEDAIDRLSTVLSVGGTNAPEDAYALGKAAPSDRVRDALRTAFAEGAPAVRRPAGGSYCAIWGGEGRFVWLDLLDRSHVENRSNGRSLLAAYGTTEDVPLEAKELKRILATRTKRSYVPPLGSELIEFLIRHHDQDEAAEALRDLTSRRSATANELTEWAQTQHPDVFRE
jgi:hypothetical protein